MKETYPPIILIVVTVVLSLACYMVYDHSGVAVTDLNIETYGEGGQSYRLSYIVRLGKTFENLDTEYILYNKENQTIGNGSVNIGNSSIWSIPVEDDVTIINGTNDKTPSKVQIIFYEYNNNTKQQERIYNKNYTFN